MCWGVNWVKKNGNERVKLFQKGWWLFKGEVLNETCIGWNIDGTCIEIEETFHYKRKERANMEKTFENIIKSIA